MKGKNELNFCTAQMIEAMQEYLDKHFVDKVQVTGVEMANNYNGYDKLFKISFEESITKIDVIFGIAKEDSKPL